MNGATTKTAGIIVIGDEILNGHTPDTNSHFFCRRLYKNGVAVKRISVIGDSVEAIAAEVATFSAAFDFVFTSGGIGTTHDDKSFLGVAVAFHKQLFLQPELTALVRTYFQLAPDDTSSAALKLAMVPESSELLWGRHRRTGHKSRFPIVRIGNVHIFPGIPQLCEKAFDQLEELLFAQVHGRFFHHQLFLNIDEVPIASLVEKVAEKYEGRVNIGSYPKIGHSYYKTKLTVDSTDEAMAQSALNELAAGVRDHTVPFDAHPEEDVERKLTNYCRQLHEKNDVFAAKLDAAISIIDSVLDDYPLQSMALSFNGGKDCTALMHLVRARLIKKFGADTVLTVVYIRPQSFFPETEQFIHEACKLYKLKLIELTGPIKSSLVELKSAHPECTVVFMGSRSTDPNAHADAKAWTDADWPRFLRVSPLIDWSYGDIWHFLRHLCIRYCPLYDKGYTSMGAKDVTGPNEALRYTDQLGVVRYRPAYELQDETLERAGRLKSNM